MTFTILLTGNLGMAQRDNSPFLGFQITPSLNDQVFDSPEKGESAGAFGISAGVVLQWELNEWLHIRSGLEYNYVRIEQLNYKPALPCDTSSAGEFDDRNSWFQDEYVIHYLGIPVWGRAYLTKGNSRLYASLGGEIMVRVGGTDQVKLIACEVFEESWPEFLSPGESSFVITCGAGLGYEFALQDDLWLSVEPNFRFSLNKLFYQSGMPSQLFNNSSLIGFGVTIGVRFIKPVLGWGKGR